MTIDEMREALDSEARRKVAVLQHENHHLKEVIRKKESRIEYLESRIEKINEKLRTAYNRNEGKGRKS